MACNDCNGGNLVTPVYSPGKYVLNPNCANPGCPDVYISEGGSGVNNHELIAGNDILIEDFSDANALRHKISYNPYIALEASLSVGAYVGGVLQTLPILKGKIVDETRATWVYNKSVASQTLDEGFGPASVPAINLLKTTTGLTMISDTIYQLSGNDGLGKSGSIATDSFTITFGNYLIWGDYTQMIGQSSTIINTLISNLANKNTEVKVNRNKSIYATGGANRYFFIIYPSAWGEGIFTKGGVEGGFTRLRNVSGTLMNYIPNGQNETPISWTNEEGYSENIYIYQSIQDYIEDAVEPITIS